MEKTTGYYVGDVFFPEDQYAQAKHLEETLALEKLTSQFSSENLSLAQWFRFNRKALISILQDMQPLYDWSIIPESDKWAATDADGTSHSYPTKPIMRNYGWWEAQEIWATPYPYKVTGVHWKNSLEQRP